ncbi:MAG TPA: carbohydrate kinase family protein, partial [Chloroflexota bacterium]|nr:carbohydrate kinase family protein [Chloroflexota bacterium]
AATARLGLRTGYATDLGNDFCSHYIHDQLKSTGIDERFIQFHEQDLTELSVGLSFPTDRTFITWDAAVGWVDRGVLLGDLRRNVVRCIFSHVPLIPEVHAEARRQGILICMDSFWELDYLHSDRVWRSIEQADIFMPNLIEAFEITGTDTAEEALAALSQRVPMVAIKLGAAGAIGSHHGRVYRAPSLAVEVVDTTGAGDNFDAGVMYGLLRDLPFPDCLRCGVVAGSLSTRRAGGVEGSATPEEMAAGLLALGPSESEG